MTRPLPLLRRMEHSTVVGIEFDCGATLLGGGPFREEDLSDALAAAPRLICADGGANRIAGRAPDAIIGDMDSIEDPDRWRRALGARFLAIEEQDSTDLEKCLRAAKAPFFLGVGFVGGRADHFLAALHAIARDARPVILLGEEDVLFAARRRLKLRLDRNDRVSFFPIAPVRARRSSGLRWPLDGLEMRAGATIGTSNAADCETVEAEFDGPGAIVILPRSRLANAIAALCLS